MNVKLLHIRKIHLLLFFMLLVSGAISAQAISIEGSVSDESGAPVFGATIRDNLSDVGTITDVDGQFAMSVLSDDSELTISFVGMKTQVIKVGSDVYFDIKMISDNIGLDELVVTGYTTERKKDLTGAVSVVDVDLIKKSGSSNVLQSMQGSTPGVQILSDGTPGGGSSSIRIRGMSTVNNASPLYVVDGVPTTEDISSLSPSDIESIQVLKDASSASIYGARAANGVVVITTRSAKSGEVTVEFDASGSLQAVAHQYEVLDASQWGEMYFQTLSNDGSALEHQFYTNVNGEAVLNQYLTSENSVLSANTNWQNEIYSPSWSQKYALTVSKGGEKGSALFSTNYIKQDGLIDYSFYERFSARINSSYKLSDKINIGENLMVSRWSDLGVTTQDDRGVTYTAFRQHPAIPVYDINNEYTSPMEIFGSDIVNPVHSLYNARDNQSQNWRIFGNAYLEVKPIKGLTLKSNIGIDHIQYLTNTLTRKILATDANSVSRAFGQGDTWTWSNTALYAKQLGEHSFSVLAGSEAISYKFMDLSGSRDDYDFEDYNYMIPNAGTATQSFYGSNSEWSMFSLFGKMSYDYKGRYMVSATLRKDASSRLGTSNNSDVFPAVTGAWRITEEEFMPSTDWLSYAKVRVAWGKNGNSEIDNYATYSSYANDPDYGIIVSSTGNSNLRWETTTQTNLGADLTFIDNRLSLSFDYYSKITKDMLTIPPALDVAGQNAEMWTNTGDMENHGFEVTLNYSSQKLNDFYWGATFNISQYKNELIKLNNLVEYTGSDIRNMEGQPLGIFYGYVTDGIFQTDAEVSNHAVQQGKDVGRLRYVDLNNDGYIDEEDQCVIGDPNPDFSMGLNLDFHYKQFTLSTFINSDIGFDIYNQTKRQLDFVSYGGAGQATNHGVETLNAWRPDNTDATIPQLTEIDLNNETRASTYFIEDGSFLKVKNVRLNYDFTDSFTDRVGLSALSIYAQVENLITITGYSGLDPELPAWGNGRGVDNAPYPVSRNFMMGLNLKF